MGLFGMIIKSLLNEAKQKRHLFELSVFCHRLMNKILAFCLMFI